jgi:energy-coupling factor transporter ATP-binding protein EcfA2
MQRFLFNNATRGNDWTHVSLGGGKFNLQPVLDEFLSMYCDAVSKGDENLHLVERVNPVGPIVIDFDFRHASPNRVYKDKHVASIVNSVQDVLIEMFEGKDVPMDALDCYILEKDSPRPDSKQHGVYKDGIHIVLPMLHCTPAAKHELRRQMLSLLPEILGNDLFSNPWSDIYDKSVIDKNGWIMYGSNKPGETSKWTLTAIYKRCDTVRNDLPDAKELVKLLSVHGPVPDHGQLDFAQVQVVTATPVSSSVTTTSLSIPSVPVVDTDALNQLMKIQSTWGIQATEEKTSEDKSYMSYKVIPHCGQCLVEPHIMHSDPQHSVMFVSEQRVTITCFSHGSRRLDRRTCERIQRLFGLLKEDKKPAEPKPFEVLRDLLLGAGKDQKLRKLDGYIYKQTHPCTYVLHETYEEFINRTLRGNAVYTSHPRNHDLLIKFLQHYDEVGLNNLVVDRNLLAFDNGVMLLRECEFVEYPGDARTIGKCARHHIPAKFDGGSVDTPLFDSLVKYQMSNEVYAMLQVMIGRLFFRAGELDNWQVMLFLYGDSGTGKSTLVNIIKAMFSPTAIAAISNNMEKVFGLEGKHDKEILMGFDTPKNMQNVLDQQMWQSMVSAEDIQIPRKNQRAISVPWKVPMVWASNLIPDYKDASGAVSRRIMLFMYRKFLNAAMKDTTLQDRIIANELPALVWKCVKAYLEAVSEHGQSDIWTFCPKELLDNQEEIRTSTDFMFRFLTASPEENQSRTHRYYVVFEEGSYTDVARVKDSFKNYMKFKHSEVKFEWPEDQSAFKKLGYSISKMHVCKACGGVAKGGRDKCCAAYNNANRSNKLVVQNMRLVAEEI